MMHVASALAVLRALLRALSQSRMVRRPWEMSLKAGRLAGSGFQQSCNDTRKWY